MDRRETLGMSIRPELWREVIKAIEDAIPEYDAINEKVSLGLAQKARHYALDQLMLREGMMVLDAGIGPGTMTDLIITNTDNLTIVGLDASRILLRAAAERLKARGKSDLHLIRGAFEALPFRDRSFDRIVSTYAFRDARNKADAIGEFSRVTASDGRFVIADLGKPENPLKRVMISFHVKILLPLIAALSKSESIKGNPWRMIAPTYDGLGTNREVFESLRTQFGKVKIIELALGGVVVATAEMNRQE